MRAVIYARYSSDQQRAASITDQIELCRRYIERQGWVLTGHYEDAAVSGASALTRPGFQRLMREAMSGTFDVVVTEAIDRLGRNLADVARCFDQLSFHRIQLHAVAHLVQYAGACAKTEISYRRDQGVPGRDE